jgi:hypothetical protein
MTHNGDFESVYLEPAPVFKPGLNSKFSSVVLVPTVHSTDSECPAGIVVSVTTQITAHSPQSTGPASSRSLWTLSNLEARLTAGPRRYMECPDILVIAMTTQISSSRVMSDLKARKYSSWYSNKSCS